MSRSLEHIDQIHVEDSDQSKDSISADRKRLCGELALANIPCDIRPCLETDIITPHLLEQSASIIDFDIEGYTAFCAAIRPELVTEIINSVFSEAIEYCRDEQDPELRPTVFPYVSAFVGDAIRIIVTGTLHKTATSFITDAIKEAMEAKMKELSLPLSLHVTVVHDAIRSYEVGNTHDKIRVDTSLGHKVVESAKAKSQLCIVDLEHDIPKDRATCSIPVEASPFDFFNSNDELVASLDINSTDDLPPTGSRELEGEILNNAPVVFIALKNFIQLEEHIHGEEPAAFHSFINPFVCRLQDTLEKYGGRIINFISGRLLIMFGRNVNDDFSKKNTSNALTACLALQHTIASFNEEQEEEHRLDWSIGLSSGRVFYGINGNAHRLAVPNVMGEPVNVAARWATTGSKGDIIVPWEVLKDLLEVSVHTRELIEAQIKGYEGTQKAINIAKFTDLVVKGIVPETILPLQEWHDLSLIETLKQANTPIISVGGPRGVGKSCLLKTLENDVEEQEKAFVDDPQKRTNFNAISISEFHTDIPFSTAIQLIRSILDKDKNGIVEHEEIWQYFPKGSKHEQIVLYFLGKETTVTRIEQKDVHAILEQLLTKLSQPHTFIIQNAQFIDEQNMQLLMDVLHEHHGLPVQCIFEFDTVKDTEQLVYDRLQNSPMVTTLEMPSEISEATFLRIAFLELTNTPATPRQAFSGDITNVLAEFYRQGIDLKTLSKRCQILKKYIVKEGGMYHFASSVNSEAVASEISTAAEHILHVIRQEYPREIISILRQMALIGPQFRFTVALKLIGHEKLELIIKNKRLCNLCGLGFTDLGEIIFKDETLRTQLSSSTAAQKRSKIHTAVTDILKEESGGRPTAATVFHSWNALIVNPPLDTNERARRMQALAPEQFVFGQELYHQAESSFYETINILNRTFAGTMHRSSRTDEWISTEALSPTDEKKLMFMLGTCLVRRGDYAFSDTDLQALKFSSPTVDEVFSVGARLPECASPETTDIDAESLFWSIKNRCGLLHLAQRKMHAYESNNRQAPDQELNGWMQDLDEIMNIINANEASLEQLGVEFAILLSEINRFRMKLLEHQGRIDEAIEVLLKSMGTLLRLLSHEDGSDEDIQKVQYEYAKNIINLGFLYGDSDPPCFDKSIQLTRQALSLLKSLPVDESLAGYQTRAEAVNNLTCTYLDNHQFNEALAGCLEAVELAQNRGLFYFSSQALKETIEEVLTGIRTHYLESHVSEPELNQALYESVLPIARLHGVSEEFIVPYSALMQIIQ